MTYQLRPHQIEAINQIRQSMINGNKRVVLKASTGFGKTLVSVDIIKSALKKKKRVMFIVDSVQLVEQTSAVFDKHGIDHGIIQADHWRYKPFENVQIASAQTLKNRKLPDTDLVIWDEGHVQHSFIVKLITEIWNIIPVITLSATPFAKNMGNVHHDLICVETTASLIEKGYLSKYTAYGCTVDLDGVKVTGGEYNQKSLEKKVNKQEIVGDIVKTWKKLGDNRQTLCFAVNVAHSKAIVNEFNINGIPAAHIDAHTEPFERNQIFKKHESGEIKILSNVNITTKGYDSPNSTCLILARPTKSLMLYIQMCGRVLRIADNGDDAIILDHGNNIQRLGFPDDDTPDELCNGDKKDKNQKKKEEIEKELKAPKPCINCGFLFTGSITCPNCGNTYTKPHDVEILDGELEKLTRKERTPAEKRLAAATKSDKQKMWSAFLQVGKSKGHSSHLYKDYYGVWPKGLSDNINLSNAESLITADKFRVAKQIRYLNRRKQ